MRLPILLKVLLMQTNISDYQPESIFYINLYVNDDEIYYLTKEIVVCLDEYFSANPSSF